MVTFSNWHRVCYSGTSSIVVATVPALTALLASIFFKEKLRHVSPIQPLYVLLMDVFSSVLAYVPWAKAFEKAEKTSPVSNYMFLTPLITGVLGFVLAGEVPAATRMGGLFILLGTFLFTWGGKK